MRLAFLGSPDFAVPALRALYDSGHSIAAVYCQPPKPAGRGQSVRRCPVHVAADALGLPVRTPRRLRTDAAAQEDFAALDLDAAVVAAYGLILPQAMLDAPRRGCLNIHASLLPRWRGAAPIQAAILAGDTETGITIMQVDAGLDTGPMLLRESVPITPATSAASLHDALAAIGGPLILRALAENPPAVPQPDEGATYAPKLSRDDARIDWSAPADAIERRVRAFNPWPGTYTLLGDAVLKVLAVAPAEVAGPVIGGTVTPWAGPGTVLDDRLTVACGSGALRLTRVQLAGRAAVAADAFLRGRCVPAGVILGGPVERGATSEPQRAG